MWNLLGFSLVQVELLALLSLATWLVRKKEVVMPSDKDALDIVVKAVTDFIGTAVDTIVSLKAKDSQTQEIDLQPDITALQGALDAAAAKLNPVVQDAGLPPVNTAPAGGDQTPPAADQPAS